MAATAWSLAGVWPFISGVNPLEEANGWCFHSEGIGLGALASKKAVWGAWYLAIRTESHALQELCKAVFARVTSLGQRLHPDVRAMVTGSLGHSQLEGGLSPASTSGVNPLEKVNTNRWRVYSQGVGLGQSK